MGRFFPILVLSALSPSGLACSDDTSGPPDGEETGFSGRDGRYTVSVFESGARGRVYYSVYLPPGWTPEGSRTYPLIFFLHGQSGDEHRFSDNVPVSELNQWINQGLAPPFVLVAPRGADEIGTVQWFYPENVTLLTSEATNEFRAFCWRTFRAGGSPDKISVQGHSRGASGAYARIRGSESIVAGSPILSLRVRDPFTKYIFCEKDADLLEALRVRVAREAPDADVDLVHGDVNDVVDEIISKIPGFGRGNTQLSFCFVDPLSVDLSFDTIRALGEPRNMDFLILLALGMDAKRRLLVPNHPIQFPASSLWRAATYLLEKERNAGCLALVPNLPSPIQFHRSPLGSTFSTHDDPVNSVQFQVDRPKQRFTGNKSNECRDIPEMTGSEGSVLVFDRRPNPNVRRDHGGREQVLVSFNELPRPGRPFREHLVNVVVHLQHHLKDTPDESVLNRAMEKVAH